MQQVDVETVRLVGQIACNENRETFRMGRPFVKRFREERELAVLLAVDVSASGAFGSARRSKREFAAEIAATTARSSVKVCVVPCRVA